jgi:hypothetical protein
MSGMLLLLLVGDQRKSIAKQEERHPGHGLGKSHAAVEQVLFTYFSFWFRNKLICKFS